MNTAAKSLTANPSYHRILEWGKMFTITSSAQSIVQGLGLVCGIMIIRMLPTQEYAFYTLTNTMLGTMTILADGGITSGVMAQGGKVWQNRTDLGTVLATGFSLRKKFGIASILVATPILFYLLMHHGASVLNSVLIVLSLIPASLAALSDNLLEIPLKLKQDINRLQKNQVAAALGRIVLIPLSIFIFPFTSIAIIGNGIPRIWANYKLRKVADEYADFSQAPDRNTEIEILAIVKRIMPTAIYYCVSGQITIWLVSIFGSTDGLAQVGALSRLATLLTVLSTVFSTLVSPRFARLETKRHLLISNFLKIQFSLIAITSIIVLATWLFSPQILFILGNEYAALNNELVLSIAGSCVSLIAGVAFALSTQRGWAMNPVFAIVTSVLSIAVSAYLIDVSSVKGVLLFNLMVAAFQVVLHITYTVYRILKIKPV